MSICLITINPDETVAQFDQVMSHLSSGGPVPPEGASLFVGGPSPDGLRTVSVWDSTESLERFFRDRLVPAYHAAGVAAERTAQATFEVHILAAEGLAAIGTGQSTGPV